MSCDPASVHVWRLEAGQPLGLLRDARFSARLAAAGRGGHGGDASPSGRENAFQSDFGAWSCGYTASDLVDEGVGGGAGLLLGTAEGAVRVCDLEGCRLREEWAVFDGPVSAVAGCRGPTSLAAVGSAAGALELLDWRRGRGAGATAAAHDGAVTALRWYSEALVLSGGADRTVAVWDARKLAAPLRRLQGHRKPVGGFRCHQTNVLSYAGTRIVVSDVHDPVGRELETTRIEAASRDQVGGRICALELLNYWHHFVVGTEDGLVKICA